MKDGYRATVSSRKKAVKKRKRISKSIVATSAIAQQYMELQRLRELVSEVESWRAMR
jgi:hypothetical protein